MTTKKQALLHCIPFSQNAEEMRKSAAADRNSWRTTLHCHYFSDKIPTGKVETYQRQNSQELFKKSLPGFYYANCNLKFFLFCFVILAGAKIEMPLQHGQSKQNLGPL